MCPKIMGATYNKVWKGIRVATSTSDNERDDELSSNNEPESVDGNAEEKAGVKPKQSKRERARLRREKALAKSARDSDPAKSEDESEKERRGLGKFFHEVVSEIKKVVTPTWQELWRYVGVVLAFLAFMMILVMLLDWIFGFGSSWVFGNGSNLLPPEWFQGTPPDPTQMATPTPGATP